MSNANDKHKEIIVNPRHMFRNIEENLNDIKTKMHLSNLIKNGSEISQRVGKYLRENRVDYLDDLDDESIIDLAMDASNYIITWVAMEKAGYKLYESRFYFFKRNKKSSRRMQYSKNLDEVVDYIDQLNERDFRLNDIYLLCADSYHDLTCIKSTLEENTFISDVDGITKVLKLNPMSNTGYRKKYIYFNKDKLQYYEDKLQRKYPIYDVVISKYCDYFEVCVQHSEHWIKLEFDYLLNRIDKNDFSYFIERYPEIKQIENDINNLFNHQKKLLDRENKKYKMNKEGNKEGD